MEFRPVYVPRFTPGRIVTHQCGFYEPCSDGQEAMLMAAHDEYGLIADIVAWLANDPSTWWLRRGDAPLLGEAEITRARDHGVTLHLFATPEGWLRNHGREYWPAACIIDWRLNPRIWLHGVSISCENRALGERLAREIRSHEVPLKITAKRPVVVAHAA